MMWWDAAPAEERSKVHAIPTVRRVSNGAGVNGAGDDRVRDVLLETLFASGSDLLLLPVQDVFGWRERINEPATVTEENWTFRLPWPIDRLAEAPDACQRRDTLRRWAEKYDRV